VPGARAAMSIRSRRVGGVAGLGVRWRGQVFGRAEQVLRGAREANQTSPVGSRPRPRQSDQRAVANKEHPGQKPGYDT
jgi:hypothetical protein